MYNKIFNKSLLLLFFIITSCSSDSESPQPEEQVISVSAAFSQDKTEILEGETITFTDTSEGNPKSWNWTFEGGNPSTSSDKNPTVLYEKNGDYSVSLEVSNADTNDESIKTNLITVNESLPEGLIAKILLDGDGIDTSGNNVNGEVIDAVTPTNNRFGSEGTAMSFNEDMGFLEFGNVEELEIGYQSAISISVWINPNGNQVDWDTVLNQFFGGGPPPSVQGRFYLGINPENQKLRWNVFGYILESSMEIPVSVWTHIVVNYENRQISMYVNGTLDGTFIFDVNDGQRPLGTGAPFRIGKQSMTSSNTTGFNGDIDDVYIFNRLLVSSEVVSLFEK